jgi:uncharacterized cupin superfamily protein
VTDTWLVVNASDEAARWVQRPGFGKRALLEPADARFPQVGIHLAVFGPGEHSTLYHAEEAQEDFIVLRGSCTAIVEDEERPVRQWDLIHCPPGTRHTFVNDGPEPCVLLMLGARTGGAIRYPVSQVALRHGAGVADAADSPADAYAGLEPWRPTDPAPL